jgi:dTDP-4-amino-4,6-dideoxygalactose transaminase
MEDRMIPFNWPYMTGRELEFIQQAHRNGVLAGDGPFTRLCEEWLERRTGCPRVLLTPSCTAALEMAALLLDIQPGDEVIMPSYTYVSTANAFALRGGIPVFVDVRQDTLNLDETQVEAAVTERTRAIVPVHYAGVACEMDAILAIAGRHKLAVVEDAAQGILSTYRGRPLGVIGDLGCFSFHETKNVTSGEGGCLLINDLEWIERAETIRDKGTDRGRFMRGEVSKYMWQDLGSSFLPGEIVAAFLWAQLHQATEITRRRMLLWEGYHQRLASLEQEGLLRRPVVPAECAHNAHMYYVLIAEEASRVPVLDELERRGVGAVSHYVPLHSSPAGRRYGRSAGPFPVTEAVAERILRLPMWIGLTPAQQDHVVSVLGAALSKNRAPFPVVRARDHDLAARPPGLRPRPAR